MKSIMKYFGVLAVLAGLLGCKQPNGLDQDKKPYPPTFSLKAGVYIGTQVVALSCESEGATIKYTVDGSDPSTSGSLKYSSPLIIDQARTVRAISLVKDLQSDVSIAQFLIFLWKGELAGPPINPVVGTAYYNTNTKISAFWDGSSWQTLARDGMDGLSIDWKGSSATAPENPSLNWGYYDSTKQTSYLWDGDSWEVLAKDGAQGATGASGVSITWKGSLTSAPATPLLNWAYYNTASATSYLWDGDSWEVLARDGTTGATGPAGATGATGTPGPAGVNGISIVWKGSLAAEPLSPTVNWGYYDTTKRASFIWDGDSWELLAQDGATSEIIVPAPALNAVSGTYTSTRYIYILNQVVGVSYRYTLDGSTNPSDAVGTLFDGPIIISSTSTLRILGYREGWGSSAIVEQRYVIIPTAWRQASSESHNWNGTSYVLSSRETYHYPSSDNSRYDVRDQLSPSGAHTQRRVIRDSLGRISSMVSYNVSTSLAAPQVTGTTVYVYDTLDGYSSRVSNYNAANSQTSANYYEYDANRRITKYAYYWVDYSMDPFLGKMKMSNVETFTYGSDGRRNGGSNFVGDPSAATPPVEYRIEYTYDSSGRNTEIRYYSLSNVLYKRTVYSYDQSGNLVTSTSYNGTNPSSQNIYTYELYYPSSPQSGGDDTGTIETIGIR